MMESPFTSEQIQEWISCGPKIFQRPQSAEQLQQAQDRKAKVTAMKKRLVKELNTPCWSERLIERELDRLAAIAALEEEEHAKLHRTGRKLPAAYQLDNAHPANIMDHRPDGGPLLEYLWSSSSRSSSDDGGPKGEQQLQPLQGQTLYLGGEVAANGNIYCIPGHASHVLVIDDARKTVYPIGPVLTSNTHSSNSNNSTSNNNGRLYKWLRGIVVGDIIYGLPCHADEILRIDTCTNQCTKIPIPYEEFYHTSKDDDDDGMVRDHDSHCAAKEQREMIWKYHGGTICPLDDCIYAIPQAAHHVLKLDPTTEEISFVGPAFPGTCKWYGGIVGKQDGAIYGIPQNASGVLRIHPDAVTVHGDFGTGNHKWHGGAAAHNGVIVSVPANANSVLCVTPGEPAPHLQMIGNAQTIQSGRHRSDEKYKYLGATAGTNGRVYMFPCASERVLQVDTVAMTAKTIGPNLRDSGMEPVHQNKWQNGLTCVQDKCVYGIALSGHTLLRIDCSNTHHPDSSSNNNQGGDNNDSNDDDTDPEVTTWLLPTPRRECRDKFEGGVMTASGVMYTVPNNHKGVLRIEPANLT